MALYAFDGTWNTDEIEDIQDTNVVRFKELYMGNNTEYLEGVGTRFGKLGRLLGGLLGTGGRTRIDEMYDELCENWAKGDEDIDIIGFSRGAALAVHFANKLGKDGIRLEGKDPEKVSIRFLGLWDIVGSFGLSFDTFINFQDINLGWDIDTVHECVENCFHAIALDERRETFNVTRLNPEKIYANITEVWFRGVHGDVGGGNENVARSNIALQWMIDHARNCGLPINETKLEQPRYSEVDPGAPVWENKDVNIDERREELGDDVRHTTAQPAYLQPGGSQTCRVLAERQFNWSKVTVREGEKYTFTISPDDTWDDDTITCGPEGWKSEILPWYKEGIVRRFEGYRRKEDANWFALIGALGNDDSRLFHIGNGSEPFIAPVDADLYLFANDMRSRYGNNSGFIDVTIRRTE